MVAARIHPSLEGDRVAFVFGAEVAAGVRARTVGVGANEVGAGLVWHSSVGCNGVGRGKRSCFFRAGVMREK